MRLIKLTQLNVGLDKGAFFFLCGSFLELKQIENRAVGETAKWCESFSNFISICSVK